MKSSVVELKSFLVELQSITKKNKNGHCGSYSYAIACAYYLALVKDPDLDEWTSHLKSIQDASKTAYMRLDDRLPPRGYGSYDADYIFVDTYNPIVTNGEELLRQNFKDGHFWSSCPKNIIKFDCENFNVKTEELPINFGGLYKRIDPKKPIKVNKSIFCLPRLVTIVDIVKCAIQFNKTV